MVEKIESDVIQIANGTYSPVNRFMNSEEVNSVLNENCLLNKVTWTLPILLQVDKELATQILFWVRAARIGSGERKTFHTVLSEIGKTSPDFISDNAKTLAQLGYWKDLLQYGSR